MTPEDIAREAAGAAVSIVASASGHLDVAVADKVLPQYHHSVDLAENHAVEMQQRLEPLFLAAIQRTLATAPVPSPVSEERLAHLRELYLFEHPVSAPPLHESVLHGRDLLAHADHQARLIAFLMGEFEGEAGRQLLADAYRRGAEAQRKACGQAAREASYYSDEADRLIAAVEAAPLATPGGGDDE